MADYRSLDDVTAEYFAEHPEEIDAFLAETFADYAQDGDSATLLSALRIVARVKGIAATAVGHGRRSGHDPPGFAEGAFG